jgi:hypothetical protein
MHDIWNSMKRPTLWIMGVEEGEELQTEDIDNVFNRMIIENFLIWRKSHPGIGSLQNTKPSGPKEKHLTQEQRKNSENCKGEKTGHK